MGPSVNFANLIVGGLRPHPEFLLRVCRLSAPVVT
jgi:hypothetical protein